MFLPTRASGAREGTDEASFLGKGRLEEITSDINQWRRGLMALIPRKERKKRDIRHELSSSDPSFTLRLPALTFNLLDHTDHRYGEWILVSHSSQGELPRGSFQLKACNACCCRRRPSSHQPCAACP